VVYIMFIGYLGGEKTEFSTTNGWFVSREKNLRSLKSCSSTRACQTEAKTVVQKRNYELETIKE